MKRKPKTTEILPGIFLELDRNAYKMAGLKIPRLRPWKLRLKKRPDRDYYAGKNNPVSHDGC